MPTLPPQFIQSIDPSLFAPFEGLAKALENPPSVSIRWNPAKKMAPADDAETIPWCEYGEYLAERQPFTFDPRLHQGAFYVQDASSMMIYHIVKHLTSAGEPVCYLDACAAPGGKTTAALSALPQRSVTVANEYVPSRAAILRENLAKWGHDAVLTSVGDTARFGSLGPVFDIIAADVPCSGEGMMRKDAEAVSQWSTELIGRCAIRQQEIVANLWPALKPGGHLIYSTCTFNRAENEDMARFIEELGGEPVEIPVDPAWGIAGSMDTEKPHMRFLPNRLKGEGLFVAVFRKKDGDISSSRTVGRPRTGKKHSDAKPGIPDEVRSWLIEPERYSFSVDGDTITALPTEAARFAGIPWLKPLLAVGRIKGRDILPTQTLASSISLRPDAFPSIDIDRDTALTYLRRESLSLPDGTPRGILLLYYLGLPLGFVKNIGRRANNLYPAEWRILSRRSE